MKTTREILRLWLAKASLAVTEQSLFAVSSFLVNVLFARWLTEQEYGSFALAYSILLLIGTVHTALFTEPLLLFGSGRYAASFRRYLSALLGGHWLSTVAVSLILFIAGFYWRTENPPLAHAFWGLALALPFVLLIWLMRRACYAHLKPRLSAAGGAVYLSLIVAGAFALRALDAVSVFSALALIGAASLVVGVWLGARLRRAASHTMGAERWVGWREVRAAHWNYGRWAMAANLLWWVPLNAGVVMLSTWGSLESSATLKAMVNIVLPLVQANAAIGALLTPTLVAELRDRGRSARLLGLCLFFFVAAGAIYYVAVVLLRAPLVHALYDGRYDHSASLLWLLALVPLLDGVAVVLSGTLRALNRPNRIFWGHLFAAASMIGFGLFAIRRWGIEGAAYAMVVSFAVACVLLAAPVYAYLRRGGKDERAAGETEPADSFAFIADT